MFFKLTKILKKSLDCLHFCCAKDHLSCYNRVKQVCNSNLTNLSVLAENVMFLTFVEKFVFKVISPIALVFSKFQSGDKIIIV